MDFDSKNLLIYGENGTGKSSIYEALYSNFYHQKRLDKGTNIQETYRNRNFITNDLEININFDNGKFLNRNSQRLTSFDILNVENLSGKTLLSRHIPIEPNIYFANEKVLNRLLKENFYIALKDTLSEHFPELRTSFIRYKEFENIDTLKNKIITKIGTTDIYEIRKQFEKMIEEENQMLNYVFNNSFPIKEINNIIKEKFDEDFKISFSIIPAESGNSEVLEFYPPVIKIKIDDIECNGKLSQHFNEAKLKLIGVAIYFALAKKYEDNRDNFKLLVLDDFLTSLDMANRKLIMKYILEEFKDYQKLILTHNLQFFNMTRKMIDLNSEDVNQWKIQKLFVHNNQAFLYDKDISYLKEADDSLSRGDEHSAGNFIRKEFERVVTEFEQLFELGVVEESKNIINTLESQDKFCIKPSEQLNDLLTAVQSALDCQDSEQQKFGYIKSALSKAQSKQISFKEKTQNSNGSFSETTIQSEIKKAKFYKNFILNPASHHDYDVNIFTKECKNAIKILKYLNTIINNLKGTKYE